ncbi:hypothetical protein E2C01_043849 [Portunus trituberculatus]|uniref:Uncharacterized protein n=1 Tax=Portunus trituberculatus TaxID=210409 RepID=A0A5B7FQI6_PORTR|nr:hypothetical protein [Portunus trituberculatus]
MSLLVTSLHLILRLPTLLPITSVIIAFFTGTPNTSLIYLKTLQIVEIQTQLGCLNLNQYTEWPGLIPSHRTPSAPHVDTQGSLLGEEEQMNKNPPSSTQTFKDHSSPLSSIILASLDLECLINSPTIQRLILHQFQRSVVNVLGLAGLFPETRQPPPNQQSVTQCSNPSPSPQDTSHPQTFAPQKVSQQAPTFSVQQGPPLQVSQVSDLASHLEYLTCPPHPGQGTTQQQQRPQEPQQQAFYQLEQQLMSGIAKSGGDFEEHGYQQQLQQHQQAFHQNPHQQIAPKHSLVMEQDNYGLIIPKEEPLGSPTSHVTHYNHPLMYDDLPCHSPLTQDSLEALETPRSFLDAHEVERFQHIQEPRETTNFESTVPQLQKVMSGQFPYHSSPNMIHPSHTSHIPIQQIPGQQAQLIPTPAHLGIPQGFQTPPQPHHTPGAPHPQLYNPGYNLPSSQTFNFESEVESGCMSPDSTYPEAVSYSPLPQQHFTAHVGFGGDSQHRTPPYFNTATATPSPPPLHHFQSHATPHHLHHLHHHSQFGQKVASL